MSKFTNYLLITNAGYPQKSVVLGIRLDLLLKNMSKMKALLADEYDMKGRRIIQQNIQLLTVEVNKILKLANNLPLKEEIYN